MPDAVMSDLAPLAVGLERASWRAGGLIGKGPGAED
jgi:hypothetical protein